MEELILIPMTRLYVAPLHLRANPREREPALDEYTRALERFPRTVLERAWRLVVEEHALSIWPAPGVIVAFARSVRGETVVPDEERQKRQRAEEMAEKAVNLFLKRSRVAQRAKQEGWMGHLRPYVETACQVQAAFLCGLQGIGFNGVLTRHLGNFDSAREALEAYRDSVRTNLAKGEIRVQVPRPLVAEWRQRAGEKPSVHDRSRE